LNGIWKTFRGQLQNLPFKNIYKDRLSCFDRISPEYQNYFGFIENLEESS
jgi:hypothetical protein